MDIPAELKTYLTTEVDQWDNTHIVCLKCKKKFFTLKDAALHLLYIHGVKPAQKYIETTP